MKINFSEDIWKIPSENITHADYYVFNFSSIESNNFKLQLKKVIHLILNKRYISEASAHRYYTGILNHFIPFIVNQNVGINYFSELTPTLAKNYILFLKENHTLKPRTKATLAVGLRSIIEYGIQENLLNFPKINPFPIELSKIFQVDDVLVTRYMTKEEEDRFIKVLDGKEFSHKKMALIIADETGLRVSDILLLRKDCLIEDFEGLPLLFAYDIKTKKHRYIPISFKAKQIIDLLIDKYIPNQNKLLFYRENRFKKGALLKQQVVRYYSVKIGKEIGLTRNITPHTFRHTLGTELLNNGASPQQVQAILGHSSLHSTNLYAKITERTLRDEYYRMPILGLINDEEIIIHEDNTDTFSLALPDGKCKNVMKNGDVCSSFYKCLFCNMYRTSVADLCTHRSHLKRLDADVQEYMETEGINSIELLTDVRTALVEIIERLEEYENK